MAFGTGHHATTTLMIQQLFDVDLKDKTVLDMGCGTGVLAIAAKKLGMKTVWVRQGFAIYQSIDDEEKKPYYIVDSIDELRGLEFEK